MEKYNFLNITNRRLGKLYKYSGYDFLPSDFDINPQTIKERLYLNELQTSNRFPAFVLESKKSIKKILKNSLKNIKKMQKNDIFNDFSKEFSQKLEIYFDMRTELTKLILKDFKNQSFDEVAAYQEIFNLDPVFGDLLDNIYQQKVDCEALFDDLENRYRTSYLEQIKKLEKKQTKLRKKQTATLQNLQTMKTKQKTETLAKKEEKTIKTAKKAAKMKEIEQIKSQNKQASAKNKKQNASKEK